MFLLWRYFPETVIIENKKRRKFCWGNQNIGNCFHVTQQRGWAVSNPKVFSCQLTDPVKRRHGKPNCEWAENSKDSSFDLRGAQSCQEYKECKMTAAMLTNPTFKRQPACMDGKWIASVRSKLQSPDARGDFAFACWGFRALLVLRQMFKSSKHQ